MHSIIVFICKWILPIGFVKLISSDKIFIIDSIGNQTYWRLFDDKKHKGAGLLIRRS